MTKTCGQMRGKRGRKREREREAKATTADQHCIGQYIGEDAVDRIAVAE